MGLSTFSEAELNSIANPASYLPAASRHLTWRRGLAIPALPRAPTIPVPISLLLCASIAASPCPAEGLIGVASFQSRARRTDQNNADQINFQITAYQINFNFKSRTVISRSCTSIGRGLQEASPSIHDVVYGRKVLEIAYRWAPTTPTTIVSFLNLH
jgi:hypothetical protein